MVPLPRSPAPIMANTILSLAPKNDEDDEANNDVVPRVNAETPAVDFFIKILLSILFIVFAQ